MKKLLNEKVTHKKYGEGTIVAESDNRITVKFESVEDEKVFIVPTAFEKFLILEDKKMQKTYNDSAVKERMEYEKKIEDRVEEIKQREEQQKQELAINKKKKLIKEKSLDNSFD